MEGPHPAFSVSVAAKEFSLAVSPLFATLARRSISVAAKGLKAIMGRDPERAGALSRRSLIGQSEKGKNRPMLTVNVRGSGAINTREG
jgi:hypothetical protein